MSSIDTSKRFYFKTRTPARASDYKVFTDGGTMSVPQSSYDQLFSLAKLHEGGEEQACASIFEGRDKIYLLAQALMCGINDVMGRRIRLSFCRIFQKNGDVERSRAYAGFVRLATAWSEAEEMVRTFLKAERDDEVRFEDEAFIEWLESNENHKVDFVRCCDGDIVMPWAYAWPALGCVLMWRKDENDDAFYCWKKGKESGLI